MKYQYLVQKNIDINQLNEFGKAGWELVQIIYYKMEYLTSDSVFYFKKPYTE